jgi:DNA-binding NtrC family response regulator
VTSRPDTTVPADETGDALADDRWAIRWIHPAFDGPPSRLGAAGLSLGRDDDCDVRLTGGEASRQHAEIRRKGPIWTVRDLDSRNGTFLNGQRVETAPLSLRDLLRVGDWIGIVVPLDQASDSRYESFHPGLYAGPVLRPVLELARRTATSSLPVIVEGETGTGKEGLSRAVHAWSGRTGPFFAVNCGAIPEALAEGELFGYRKGAFTGADRAHLGYFRAANGGTLLLDEIVDLPAPLQTKLLRALEQHEVVPLGESAPVVVDVRVVAAAQEALADAVKERRFRADLYARLAGVTLRLPPLRERVEEIPFLVTKLLADHATAAPPRVEARAMERLCLYDWPFNLRELDLLVRRLLVLHPDGQIRRADLPDEVKAGTGPRPAAGAPPPPPKPAAAPKTPRSRDPEDQRARDEEDLASLMAALRVAHGNVVRAAEVAGMSRQRAYRLMGQRADIDLQQLRDATNKTAGGEN